MDWTICGRAPSLLSTTAADCLDGPVTAINGAILHHALPFTHWACLDEPKPPYDSGQPWREKPALVTKNTNAEKWANAFPALAKPTTYGSYDHMRAALPWTSRAIWLHWSVLLALYHAYQHGARRIRFLGVEMAGDRYAYHNAVIGRKSGADERWKRERLHVAQGMTELAVHGGVEFPDLPFVLRTYACPSHKPRNKPPPPEQLAYVTGPMQCECGQVLRAV